VKAQVSITCVPWVLMIFMVWPARRRVAMPWRAGMVVRLEDIALMQEREIEMQVVIRMRSF